MRWEDFRTSEYLEDRRGDGGGGGGGIPMGRGGLGIGTMIILGLVGWALGIDPRILIGGAEIIQGGGPRYEQPYQPDQRRTTRTVPQDDSGKFVAAVIGNTEDTWKEIFQEAGRTYRPARVVLFSGASQGGCGMAHESCGHGILPLVGSVGW